MFLYYIFHLIIVIPVNIEVVGHIFRCNARIAQLLSPGCNTVIIALYQNGFFPSGGSFCNHQCKACYVTAVLCKEGPIRHSNSINHKLGQIYYN